MNWIKIGENLLNLDHVGYIEKRPYIDAPDQCRVVFWDKHGNNMLAQAEFDSMDHVDDYLKKMFSYLYAAEI